MNAAVERVAASAAPRFFVRELPDKTTIMQHMAAHTDYRAACARVAPRRPVRGLLAVDLPERLLEGLRESAGEAIRRHGLHTWLTAEGRRAGESVQHLSLTCNPDLEDPAIEDVHQSTLGTSKNRANEFYWGSVQRFEKLKHTYFDSYGFRLLTPAARIGALGEFLSQCRLSPIRSRLSLIRGDSGGAWSFAGGWHRDEPVFENLRINIPLRTDSSFRLELEHELDGPDPSSATMTDHYLEPGKGYSFDTHRPHRVFASTPSDVDRIHLVLGFAPWFRYDAAADAWEPNEYYGRVHPFDIVRGGALHPQLVLP